MLILLLNEYNVTSIVFHLSVDIWMVSLKVWYHQGNIDLLCMNILDKYRCLCLFRLVLYLERDLRKAIPVRNNPSQSGYLCQCLDLLIIHLSAAAQAIMGTSSPPFLFTLTLHQHTNKLTNYHLKVSCTTNCVNEKYIISLMKFSWMDSLYQIFSSVFSRR